MIEDRDLDAAVAAGIIDSATRARLMGFVGDLRRGSAGPDEENFRLLTGFNDIFVTIAIGLLLFALTSLGAQAGAAAGPALAALAAWGLAEYFTRRRRMALPSIVLLLAFVAAVFGTILALGQGAMGDPTFSSAGRSPWLPTTAAAAAAVAAAAHWLRFKVPITVAAGVVAAGVTVIALVAATVPGASQAIVLPLVFVLGLAGFVLAMGFDARDPARLTRWTDVAFWLHLVSAPAIIHPVFALTGVLRSDPAPAAAVLVVVVYAVLTLVALAIDRRALLVSALGYVIYAIQALVRQGDNVSLSFALTALVIGSFLVLLSAAWRPIRARVLALLPANLSRHLPIAA